VVPLSGISPFPTSRGRLLLGRYNLASAWASKEEGDMSVDGALPVSRPKVRLLLDVDGVLNALSSVDNPGDFWTDCRVDVVDGYSIAWSPSVVAFVRDLHDRGVDVQWLTTWGRRANEQLRATLDLPELPVLGERGDGVEDTWWKLVLIQAVHQSDGVPFVWIDDEIDYDQEAIEWLGTLPPGRFLAVTPDSMTGIDPCDIERVNAFVDRWLDRPSDLAGESDGSEAPSAL
jgi:hypothetical protein